MRRNTWAVWAAALLIAGCSVRSWMPWGGSSGDEGSRVPPGTTVYACQGGKRLLVRYEREAKSAWVIYSAGEYRLDSMASAAGEQYGKGRTVLTVRDGEATLVEDGTTQFAGCKAEAAK